MARSKETNEREEKEAEEEHSGVANRKLLVERERESLYVECAHRKEGKGEKERSLRPSVPGVVW